MRTALLTTAASLLLVRADDSSTSSTATTGIPATQTHDVKVGQDGLQFSPDNLSASPGDLLNFHFYASNHSVAQSSYDKPCEPMDSGIFSGFFSGASGKSEDSKVFSMRLNGTDPVWLYCSKEDHCKSGQAMVINAPSNSDQSLKEYKEKAKKVDSVKSPSNVYGGVVRDKPTSTSTGATASATKKSGSASLKIGGAASTVGLLAGVAGLMFML